MAGAVTAPHLVVCRCWPDLGVLELSASCFFACGRGGGGRNHISCAKPTQVSRLCQGSHSEDRTTGTCARFTLLQYSVHLYPRCASYDLHSPLFRKSSDWSDQGLHASKRGLTVQNTFNVMLYSLIVRLVQLVLLLAASSGCVAAAGASSQPLLMEAAAAG